MSAPKDPIKYQEWREKLSISHKGLPSPRKGVSLSEETKKKISLNKMGGIPWNKGRVCNEWRGLNNTRWKGDLVGYRALHLWLNKTYDKPSSCECCGRVTKWLDWSNISGEYKRDISDYECLCRSCHRKKEPL